VGGEVATDASQESSEVAKPPSSGQPAGEATA
jgi:hypothetical protein